MQKIKAIIEVCRPHQYLKNGLVWLPLFFDHKLLDPTAFWSTLAPFCLFCLCASAVYVFNDIRDVDQDREHPVKRFRPIASHALSIAEAWVILGVLVLAAAIFGAIFLSNTLLVILGVYLGLNLAYSIVLKHVAIVDVVCIAIGMELRVFAGGVAANVSISHWIIIMTFLLALFLALAKRRDDLLLAEKGYNTRISLDGYTMEFVSLSMSIMASVTIVAYILYTVSPDVVEKHGTTQLYLTCFWVVMGILRYMQVTFVEEHSGSPTKVLSKDVWLQATVAGWVTSFYFLLYRS